ncbi:hypothetical protein BN77_p11637 [Rhizobium mesoamericanum STM3625]|uniref:Uncharacterized protein n=1 Tax=Rhizobium mesoamericanum STM3625 TaxID=1211777 RepID=K0Q5X3_9HYPH|nr:hypothetical protein BN77_p11637 [Rhizobium mesoamericanum STM3625]
MLRACVGSPRKLHRSPQQPGSTAQVVRRSARRPESLRSHAVLNNTATTRYLSNRTEISRGRVQLPTRDKAPTRLRRRLASARRPVRTIERPLLSGRHYEEVLRLRPGFAEAHNNDAVFLEGRGKAAKGALKTAPEHGRSSARRISMRSPAFSLIRKRRPGANLRWVDQDKPDVEGAGRTANKLVKQIGQQSVIRQLRPT